MLYHIAENFWTRGLGVLTGLAGLVSWSVALALGGYGYKSFYSYQVKKQTYSLVLTRNLYYRSLDNNTGVLMRVLDEAEEQECRETLLAYFCLLKYAPPQGWTPEQLDDYVELYLEGSAGLKVDFEIGDALAKLERLKLVTRNGDRYAAAAVEAALRERAGELLESVRLFDVYTGPQVGEGRKSLAFALRLRAPDRTLTEAETAQARDAAVGLAAERHGAVQRT